jgi:branched-chain amino acid transport system substrate-binding protein
MSRHITALACALGLSASVLATSAYAQDKIRIGFITTLSGPTAVIGNDMRNSVELALDHIGRKMGGKDVEIIYEDDQQRPDVGKQKADKLVQQDKVPMIAGVIWSNVLLALYKEAADAGVFVFSSNAGASPPAGEGCHQNFFNVSWTNDQPAMAMGEVLNKRGLKSVYLMAPNYAAGRESLGGFKRTFKGNVAGEDYTKWPGQLDFSAELAKVRASGAEWLHVFYPGASGVQFLAQYEQSGLKGKVPLSQVFTIDSLSLPQQKETALGVRSAGHWAVDLPNEANKRFVGDFLKKHNAYPSFYGQQSYDTIMLIASAVAAVKGDMTKKDEIRNALRKADFKSTRGEFRYGHNHFPIQDFYLQETGRDEQGRLMVKTLEPIFKAHRDPFADQCKMKW